MLNPAVNELLAAYGELQRFLVRELGDRELALEFAQTSFERTYAYALDGTADSIRALLFRTARNLCIDKFRRDRLVRWEQCDPVEMESHAPEAIAHDNTPERVTLSRDMLERIAVVIDNLPSRTREAFVLARIHGLSHEEVARELGISKSAVEKLVVRGLSACRELLET